MAMTLLHRCVGRVMAVGMAGCAILAGVSGGPAEARAALTHTAARPGHITPDGAGSLPVVQPSGYVRVHVADQAAGATEAIPIFFVGSSPAVLNGLHTCLVMGNDGNTQGVECADVVAESDRGLGVRVAPFVQAVCQSLSNPGSFPQCGEIDIVSGINNAQSQFLTGFNNNTCGPPPDLACLNGATNGPNPGIRNEFLGNYADIQGCNEAAGGPNEVWAVDLVNSLIELPGTAGVRPAKNVFSSRNLASGHAIVCGV
jgi:hypothetical protein